MKSLTLGVVAHVDAGKTSLTERLLFEAGARKHPGSVDAGTTLTDSMDLERRRGITIRASVTSFEVDDVVVNLVDTPGHPDFIAEVERSLSILEGAIVVVSAVEGIQPQTTILVRALQRVGVPFVYFINKVDRMGADAGRVARDLAGRFHSEQAMPPVRSGSATCGTGVAELLRELPQLLPGADHDESAPLAATVFKVERSGDGARSVFVQVSAGVLAVRDRVAFTASTQPDRVTGITVFDHGRSTQATRLVAGRVGIVRGLSSARIGDRVGTARPLAHEFRAPSLEAVVAVDDPADRPAMRAALDDLSDQDPLIQVRHDEARRETSIALNGEVQREVIASRLADEYGVSVSFSEAAPLCVERVLGVGESVERMGVDGNPFLACIGLRVEPAAPGTGVEFDLGAARGYLPTALAAGIDEGVRATLLAGPHGWPIPDCRVRIIETKYSPRQSHAHQKFNLAFSSVAGDFRGLAPLVLMQALRRAGTVVCEPIARFELDVPYAAVSPVLSALARFGGYADGTRRLAQRTLLTGVIPVRAVSAVRGRLIDLSGGEASLVTELSHYDPVIGAPVSRARVDDDPTDRIAYLRAVGRRVGRV